MQFNTLWTPLNMFVMKLDQESLNGSRKKSSRVFVKELKDNGWADEIMVDEFTISRHALVGFTKIIGVMLILASLIQFIGLIGNPLVVRIVSIASILLVILSLTILILSLFYTKNLLIGHYHKLSQEMYMQNTSQRAQ